MIDVLEKYYQDGWLLKQTHPTLDLTIWNYSPKVQYERYWDDITLQCRGLVTNSKGEIVARPFKKFFNYEELIDVKVVACRTCNEMGLRHCAHPNECGEPKEYPIIPDGRCEVYQKMDGSLGIYFFYADEWHMATRGSFISDQAVRGMKIMKEKYNGDLNPLFTFLFEIIYPENRIVCEYDEEQLVLLGAVRTESESGNEMDYQTLEHYSKWVGKFPLVKKWNINTNDYSSIKKQICDDEEGVVVKFENGFRMKIKGDEYCRLHRILTNVSTRNIWEYLKENKPFDDILDKVPDEFYGWVKSTVKDFETKFENILGHVITDYWEIDEILNKQQKNLGDDMVYGEREYAKAYAEQAFKRKYPHLLFSYRKEILSPVRTSKAIWDLLYPEFEKPFKKEYEE